jgi:hypothetical protein
MLCVALSLADVHVIKWQCPLKLVRSTWSTPYCKGTKTKWESAIGYLVVVELCVALSLADIHVIKWQFSLKSVRTAWRTPNSSQPGVNG